MPKKKSASRPAPQLVSADVEKLLSDLWIRSNLIVQVLEWQALTNPDWDRSAGAFLGSLAEGVRSEIANVRQELKSAVAR